MTRTAFPETPKASPVVVGIDPGLDGAVAFLSLDGGTPEAKLAPAIAVGRTAKGGKRRGFDERAMVGILAGRPIALAVIEAVRAAPTQGRRQGASSMFNFGVGYGLWLGIMAALKIPVEKVAPQSWKADVLKGTSKDKDAAIAFVRARFPGVELKASPRCRVEHDGIADALCLAEYARRRIVGSGPIDTL